jgi:uncharacterized protein (TIGR00251 family)
LSSSSADSSRPWRRIGADGSITLTIHARPGAKRSGVTGVHGDCLRIQLAAPAVEGKANAALLAFLAEAFAVPKHALTLVQGVRSRRKIVRVVAPRQRPDRGWGEPGEA